jgi:acetyltransferase
METSSKQIDAAGAALNPQMIPAMHAAAAGLGAALRGIGARGAIRPPHIRPIRRTDAPAVQAFVAALSDRSRMLRYFRPLRELPPRLLDRLVEADAARDRVFVALENARAGARIVGLAQYALEDHVSCEFALVVADEWQGRGVGRRLLQILLDTARQAGVRRMHGDVLRQNRAMLGLARALGFAVGHSPLDAGAVRVTRLLEGADRPTPRRLSLAGASF